MATYVGFYRQDPNFAQANGDRARAGDSSPDSGFAEKVINLRDNLPGSLKLIGSWATIGPDQPSVWICETDDIADLQAINQYYTGYLVFSWAPARTLGATSSETRSAIQG